jgi:hypothetical protein
MNLSQSLFLVSRNDYGSDYRGHLLQQYMLYVEMADRIRFRRQIVNGFFLVVNLGLLRAFREVAPKDVGLVIVVALVGGLLCYTWYRLMCSYDRLNSDKFKVSHTLEHKLPAAPYHAEWVRVAWDSDASLYPPSSRIERRIPGVFAALYVGFAVWNALDHEHGSCAK